MNCRSATVDETKKPTVMRPTRCTWLVSAFADEPGAAATGGVAATAAAVVGVKDVATLAFALSRAPCLCDAHTALSQYTDCSLLMHNNVIFKAILM